MRILTIIFTCLGVVFHASDLCAETPPRRFAVESAALEIFSDVTLIGDGLSAVQSVAFINWGSIQTNAPVGGVNEYLPFPSNSWWATFLDGHTAEGRGLKCTLELGATSWAVERDPGILVQNPSTGVLEAGLVRILPEYTETWQDFIKYFLSLTPQVTHVQIESEPDNVWVNVPGYMEALRLAYDAVQDFNADNPGRNVKVLAAGFNLADLIQVPESYTDQIVSLFPGTVELQTLRDAFPSVNDEVLQRWSRKLHLVVGVLSQENPANPSFDILSVHHDRGRTYDTAQDLVNWYRRVMTNGVHGAYDRPIWVDDMSSNYHVSSGSASGDEALLLDGLEEGNQAVIDIFNAQQPIWLVRKSVGFLLQALIG
jgi:hypothetical protein